MQNQFITAHRPELKNDVSDLIAVDTWLVFIKSLGKSNIISNFAKSNTNNLFQGIESPANVVFVNWICDIFGLQATTLAELKVELVKVYGKFLGSNASPQAIENGLDGIFFAITDSLWGMQIINPIKLLNELDPVDPHYVNKLNHWREDVLNMPLLADSDIQNITSSIQAINWRKFCADITNALSTPQFLSLIELHQKGRSIIKDISREIAQKQINLLNTQAEVSTDCLMLQLMQEFIQTFLSSLAGMDEAYLRSFTQEFFAKINVELSDMKAYLQADPNISSSKQIQLESIKIFEDLIPRMKTFAVIPSSQSNGELAILVSDYGIKAQGLAAEIGEEAALWLSRLPHFVLLWIWGYANYNELIEGVAMTRKSFLHIDRPSITRDCVGRVAVEQYFQFLYNNFVPLLKEEQIFLVSRNHDIV